MKLDSSVAAVITGGGSGLGKATASALAYRGARVSIFDYDEARGVQTAQEIGAHFAKVDVTSSASLEQAFASARANNGQERIVINCAGTATAARLMSSKGLAHAFEVFERVVAVNLLGTYKVVGHAVAGMRSLNEPNGGERGVIVNTASIAAFEGQLGQAGYAASKGGVVGLTLPLARELAGLGIRVCSVAPGVFDTSMVAAMSEEVRASLSSQAPFPPRFGHPDEFASLVVHLCENPYINGEVIRIDGAMRMAGT